MTYIIWHLGLLLTKKVTLEEKKNPQRLCKYSLQRRVNSGALCWARQVGAKARREGSWGRGLSAEVPGIEAGPGGRGGQNLPPHLPFLCDPPAAFRANGAKLRSLAHGERKTKTESAYEQIDLQLLVFFSGQHKFPLYAIMYLLSI